MRDPCTSRRDCPVVILPSKLKHMYIDPGAGSIVIQAVSAVVIAAAASMGRVRRFVASVVERFRR